MELSFRGEVWFWKGPSPWHFVTVPEEECEQITAVAAAVSYGWGVIPVTVHLGSTTWQTSLFPQEDRYLVPIKAGVREAEAVELGDLVTLRLTVGRP